MRRGPSNMAVGNTLGKTMAVRNSLWSRKYGELCKNECSLPKTPSLYQCIAVTLPHGCGSAKKRVGVRESEGHEDAA